jgi:hypothetical protein
MKRISFFLIVVFFISACSLSSIGLPKKATPTAAVEVVPPTDIPQATETEVVEPTLAPLPTDTPEPLPTVELVTDTPALPTDTATPEMEAWRLPPMPGAEFVANEKKSDPAYDSIMSAQATNLAVAQPYYWDLYSVEPLTRYKVIQAYFVPAITQMGFALSVDVQGNNEVYLMKFTKKQSKSQIYVQYNGTTAQQKTPAILIFYSKP